MIISLTFDVGYEGRTISFSPGSSGTILTSCAIFQLPYATVFFVSGATIGSASFTGARATAVFVPTVPAPVVAVAAASDDAVVPYKFVLLIAVPAGVDADSCGGCGITPDVENPL